jgi:uncharacterized protein with GYD domain
MATYLMFGSYSLDSIGKISAERTVKANALVDGLGGEIKAGYAMLGDKDLLLIVDLPGTGAAMKASAGLSQLLGIEFTTAPAVTVEEFDKLFE